MQASGEHHATVSTAGVAALALAATLAAAAVAKFSSSMRERRGATEQPEEGGHGARDEACVISEALSRLVIEEAPGAAEHIPAEVEARQNHLREVQGVLTAARDESGRCASNCQAADAKVCQATARYNAYDAQLEELAKQMDVVRLHRDAAGSERASLSRAAELERAAMDAASEQQQIAADETGCAFHTYSKEVRCAAVLAKVAAWAVAQAATGQQLPLDSVERAVPNEGHAELGAEALSFDVHGAEADCARLARRFAALVAPFELLVAGHVAAEKAAAEEAAAEEMEEEEEALEAEALEAADTPSALPEDDGDDEDMWDVAVGASSPAAPRAGAAGNAGAEGDEGESEGESESGGEGEGSGAGGSGAGGATSASPATVEAEAMRVGGSGAADEVDQAVIDWRAIEASRPLEDRAACESQLATRKLALMGATSLAERCRHLKSMGALKAHLDLATPAGAAPPPEFWEFCAAALDELADRGDATPQVLHELAQLLLVELGRAEKAPASPNANQRQLAVQQAAVDAVGAGSLNNLTRSAEPGHYSIGEALLRLRVLLTWGRCDVDHPKRYLHKFLGHPTATLTRLVASLSSLMGRKLTDAEEDQARALFGLTELHVVLHVVLFSPLFR